MQNILKKIKEIKYKENIKANWIIGVSGCFFFCLNFTYLTKEKIIGIFFACLFIIVGSSVLPSHKIILNRLNIRLKIYSFLTALGILLANQSIFYDFWQYSSIIVKINELFKHTIDVALIISIVCMVMAFPFVFIFVCYITERVVNYFKETEMFSGLSRSEYIIYSVLFFLYVILIIFLFTGSNAFYGSSLSYDVLYTSDSASLMKNSVYMYLFHSENDIRQPLFALFAAPFTGFPYLIGTIIFNSEMICAILIDVFQVLLMFTANLILCRMLCRNSKNRIALMAVISTTYTTFLFSIMMEQYIIAYFWLIMAIYEITNKNEQSLFLYGAGGSLLTSVVLFPVSASIKSVNFKDWVVKILQLSIGFALLMVAFGRLDVILNVFKQLTELSSFSGVSLSTFDKFAQYTVFIRNCFIGPDAGPCINSLGNMSWQLNAVTGINSVGLVLLIVSLIAFVCNRNNKLCRISFIWFFYSFLMLSVIGWGTIENGLILYSLYFGWPFIVLLYKLLEKLEDKLKFRNFSIYFCLILFVMMFVYNLSYIIDMCNFALKYYPL